MLKPSRRGTQEILDINTHVHGELVLYPQVFLTKCCHVLINLLCYPERVGGHSYLFEDPNCPFVCAAL